MRDIQFSIETNDIVFNAAGTDIALTTDSGATSTSDQNGALIFAKSAVSLYAPQFGAGFAEKYENLDDPAIAPLLTTAVERIYEDGATYANIERIEVDGEYAYQVQVKYPNQ